MLVVLTGCLLKFLHHFAIKHYARRPPNEQLKTSEETWHCIWFRRSIFEGLRKLITSSNDMVMQLLYFAMTFIFVLAVCEVFCKIRIKLRLTIANKISKKILELLKIFRRTFKHCFNHFLLLFNSLYHSLRLF